MSLKDPDLCESKSPVYTNARKGNRGSGMNNSYCILSILLAMSLAGGCGRPADSSSDQAEGCWTATELVVTEGFHVPEGCVLDETAGVVYVSNIESAEGEYWTDDSKGYIATLGTDGKVIKQHWINSETSMILHAPKGMCLVGKYLYFSDNTRVMRCEVGTGDNVEVVATGFKKANDMATDGKDAWVSDGGAGEVFCIKPDGSKVKIQAPESVNGITFHGDKMYAVSWDLHDLYELDSTGAKEPVPFGLADHFTNLDGIEVLDDGTFIVSDFMGNKVSTVSADRKTVKTLVELESPADFSINRKEMLLYVPQFMKNKVVTYQLNVM